MDWIHLDVMDGHFVPNITFGPDVIAACRPHATVPFEAHLMVYTPEQMAREYIDAGCRRLIVHAEACTHLHRVLGEINDLGAAAAVASGLRVRLVDVTEDGRIDRKCLETLPLERTAAIVVCNLFGLAEPIANTLSLAHAAGVLVVDDAAQAFGALGVDGPAGGRGDIGILSFGRGKPLSGLGGGAIAWNTWPAELPDPRPAEPARAMAALRAAAYDVALAPPVFHALSRIPALGIGETHFDVDFARGPIDPGAMALAAATLPSAGVAADARAAEALRLADRLAPCGLRPIMAIDGARGVYPRFFGLAPDAAARDAALAALRPIGAGATAMYPTALDQVPGLRPHLCGVEDYPGARDLAARLLTLPSNGGLRANRLRKAERLLQKTLMQQS